MSRILELMTIIENGKAKDVEKAVDKAIEEGIPATDILNEGLIAPINSLGEKFRLGQIFVPELLLAAKTMKMGVERIKPLLVSEGSQSLGKALFCTVKGDMHDIGKNIVVLFMESAGFEVINLGMDVPPEDIVEAVEENEDVKIIGMSAMLTTTMYSMKDTVEALEEAGLRDNIKIMIGGAPVNNNFAESIGADGFSSNATSAVDLAKSFIA